MTIEDKQEIKSVIAKVLNVDTKEIKDDTDLINDLGADSLDMVEISLGLEETTIVKHDIEYDESMMLTSVNKICDYIKNKNEEVKDFDK